MSYISDLIGQTDWWAVASGAIIGAISMGLRTVIQAPVKALAEQSKFIRWLSLLSPQRPFKGYWEVEWKVDSSRLPELNADRVKVYSLFGNVTFTTNNKFLNGSEKKCVFVGKLVDRTLTGRWYDPENADRAYFGVFQIKLHGGVQDGRGVWIGWTNDGKIQSNDMTMQFSENQDIPHD